MDGVMRGATPSHTLHTRTTTKEHVIPHSSIKQPVMDIARPRSSDQPSHHLEHSKTLMRSAVSKPIPKLRKIKSQSADTAAPTTLQPLNNPISTDLAAGHLDKARFKRASRIRKSKLVQHFNMDFGNSKPSLTEVVPPSRPLASSTALGSIATSASSKPSLDIFEKALASATAHEQPFVKPASKRSRLSRRLKITSAVCATLIIVAGFLVYQNAGSINLYMASSKAGFQASLPSYRPSGFALGGLSSSTGTVAATFTSNSDSRAFTLTEEPSDWDSPTLRDTFVVNVAGQNYQTIQSDGDTIFLYGTNNATWVSGGIWYQLTSRGSLSNQQLIEIANSL
jgi:hypothetical protein